MYGGTNQISRRFGFFPSAPERSDLGDTKVMIFKAALPRPLHQNKLSGFQSRWVKPRGTTMAKKFPLSVLASEKREGNNYAARSVAGRMISKFIESCDTEFMRIMDHIHHHQGTVANPGVRSDD